MSIGSSYNIYPHHGVETFGSYDDPHLIPELDAYVHVLNWIKFLSIHYCAGHPLKPTYPLFPSCSPCLHNVRWDVTLSTNAVNELLSDYGRKAGLNTVALTSHCFQHGGLQYWLLFAPVVKCWSINMCQLWGGWSPNENVSTPNPKILM